VGVDTNANGEREPSCGRNLRGGDSGAESLVRTRGISGANPPEAEKTQLLHVHKFASFFAFCKLESQSPVVTNSLLPPKKLDSSDLH